MKKLLILTLTTFCLIQANAQNWDQVFKAVASDRSTQDLFGYSVSISGNYAIIGAYNEAEDEVGGNSVAAAGSAYLFERDGSGSWTQVQKIVASDRAFADQLGKSVSISGNYAILGAINEDEDAAGGNTLNSAGSAYLFERDTSGNWNEVQKIVASDRGAGIEFGMAVSISGNYAIVGTWRESRDAAGGNPISRAGAAYIYERDTAGVWSEVQKIVASDRAAVDEFGFSVSISGDYAIVAAAFEDEDSTGGNTISNAGSVYVFKRDGSGIWNEEQKIVASDRGAFDQFGFSVSISGARIMVGARLEDHDVLGVDSLNGAGSAYLFERDGSGYWNQVQKVVASDRGVTDYFGHSVSVSGDIAIAGVFQEDEDSAGGNTMGDAGSAYVFQRDSSGNWNQVQKIVASDRGSGDYFGFSVSISGNYSIFGAYQEDEDTTGGNTMSRSGSAYFFEGTCLVTYDTINPIACDSYLSPSGGQTWTSTGIYLDTVTIFGCEVFMIVNLTINKNTNETINPTACFSYISPSGNYTWDSSGTYMDTIPNGAACDSVLTINLTINTVDTSVIKAGPSITSNATGAAYQWLDCDFGHSVISGETNQNFMASKDGRYAVEVTENGCTDTSACYEVIGIGIQENDLGFDLIVYPNPTTADLNIDLGKSYSDISVSICNVLGQIISTNEFGTTNQFTVKINGPSGLYFIKIRTGKGDAARLKVVKE